jgi:hypothetical protein
LGGAQVWAFAVQALTGASCATGRQR